ncbi:MAG: DNA-binding protein [Thermoprotei archaeon]|nr:MAG: DNA-binding protein [Thermoprotei archaeon]
MQGNEYLFDASSIVNLIKRGCLRVFEKGMTIELALYESLNAVWKEHTLLKRIDKEVALEYAYILSKVFEAIKVASIRGLETEVYKIACKESLTIYDASYLCFAAKNGLALVTDDKKLEEKASRYVKVLNSSTL